MYETATCNCPKQLQGSTFWSSNLAGFIGFNHTLQQLTKTWGNVFDFWRISMCFCSCFWQHKNYILSWHLRISFMPSRLLATKLSKCHLLHCSTCNVPPHPTRCYSYMTCKLAFCLWNFLANLEKSGTLRSSSCRKIT